MENILLIIWKFIRNAFIALFQLMIRWVMTRPGPEPFVRFFAGIRNIVNMFR